ncbi:MAG: heat-inducible transcription repressor HrcA [Bdellovibrionales bacterium]|nr:heat-inducible transcription repressor HrcA [Bdellovibrionales bacterium]
MSTELADRKKRILYAVINDYIVSAEPIGSQQIASKKNINLSPATVRSVMAELEERGFLKRAHSSSGRTPTDTAYRIYVDQLMNPKMPSLKDREGLRSKLNDRLKDLTDLPRDSSRVLSDVVKNASIAAYPKTEERHIEHIRFCKLKGHLVLAILVSSSGLVENKILKLTKNLKQSELDQMHNYLNEYLKGLTIGQAKRKILEDIQDEHAKYDQLLHAALTMSQKTFEQSSVNLHIEGQSKLFMGPDFLNFEKMQNILKILEEKTVLAAILEDCLRSPGVKILIGEEFNAPEINGLTMITAPYNDAEGNRGILGVIAPTRVDYARVVPLVEYTSNLVTNVLQESKL